MDISYVPEGHPLWPIALELTLPAARRGRIQPYEAGDVVWAIYDGNVLLGAAVTRLDGNRAEIRTLAGKGLLKSARKIQKVFSRWAKDAGARTIEIYGRPGWRKFQGNDWQEVGADEEGRIIYRKEL